MSEKFIPPLHKGQRVRSLVEVDGKLGVGIGALGTITWTHPSRFYPYRVHWDGVDLAKEYCGLGMDDIGWLTAEDDLEAVNERQI